MWTNRHALTLERPIIYFTCRTVHNHVQKVGCEHSKVKKPTWLRARKKDIFLFTPKS